MKRFLIGAAMVAGLAACSGGGTGPAAVVEDFARKLEAGNCTGLRDSLAASGRDLIGPKLEQGCNAQKGQPKPKAVRSFRVLEERIDGERATVRLEAEYSDNTKDGGEPITLVREDGRWKIDLLAAMGNQMGGSGPGAGAGAAPGAPGATAPTPQATPAPAQPGPAAPATDAPAAEEGAAEDKE